MKILKNEKGLFEIGEYIFPVFTTFETYCVYRVTGWLMHCPLNIPDKCQDCTTAHQTARLYCINLGEGGSYCLGGGLKWKKATPEQVEKAKKQKVRVRRWHENK